MKQHHLYSVSRWAWSIADGVRVGGRPHKPRHTYRTGRAQYWAMRSPGAAPTSWLRQDPRGSPWMRAWARWARLHKHGLNAQGGPLAGLACGALLEFWRRRALNPVVLPLLHWYSPSLQLYVLYMWDKLHQISSLSVIGRSCNIKVHALSEDAITWLQQTRSKQQLDVETENMAKICHVCH